MTDTQSRIFDEIAEQIGARPAQVAAAAELLDSGATVPFIARYRKEVTGGLDDIQLRLFEERLGYLRELADRRATVLASIEEQGKLSDELKADILAADTKARLEDLYLPYKPKRRTKAQIAREAGLEPLAVALRDDAQTDPEVAAAAYVNVAAGVEDVKAALDGARAILIEAIAEDATLVGSLREWLWEKGRLQAKVLDGKQDAGAKYRDYFDHAEAVARIPSHRLLALLRGRNEGILSLDLLPAIDGDVDAGQASAIGQIGTRVGWHDQGRPADAWRAETLRHAWRFKLLIGLSLDLMLRARESAEEEAIRIFGDNLKDLLLSAPAGSKAVMGLDPGLRTGAKVVVVDATGKLLATDTIYPFAPRNQWDASVAQIASLCKAYGVELVAIGNGTASRESDRLVGDVQKRHPELRLEKIVVSEAGASVYSASELASKEFPDVDVSLRGAISIARRLQDPLAELVKIDPKSIGVGQYQHDVNQTRLARALDARGAFRSRAELLKVPRLGEKTFEQCAGFLRVREGDDPLDASAVHPEAYPVVKRILEDTGRELSVLIGDSSFLRGLNPERYTDDRFGVPTVRDILAELEKPGRDPRPEFKTARFAEGVEDIKDLQPGMVLEGVVSNVVAFGAFIDLGVHQDGLVHVSALADKFVKDPRDVVKAGDIVKVKVMEVDLARKRIALSMRLDDTPGEQRGGRDRQGSAPAGDVRQARGGKGVARGQSKPDPKKNGSSGQPAPGGAFAAAFAKAKKS